MGWFKRIKGGITTSTKEKKETPEGLWYKNVSLDDVERIADISIIYICILVPSSFFNNS